MDLHEIFIRAQALEREREFDRAAMRDMINYKPETKTTLCVACYFNPCRCGAEPYDCGAGV